MSNPRDPRDGVADLKRGWQRAYVDSRWGRGWVGRPAVLQQQLKLAPGRPSFLPAESKPPAGQPLFSDALRTRFKTRTGENQEQEEITLKSTSYNWPWIFISLHWRCEAVFKIASRLVKYPGAAEKPDDDEAMLGWKQMG